MRRVHLLAIVLAVTCIAASASAAAIPAPSSAGECLVPNVVGTRLAPAKAAIAKAGCRAGKIKDSYSNYVPKGVVMTQNPPGGFRLAGGAKITLVVSKGKRP